MARQTPFPETDSMMHTADFDVREEKTGGFVETLDAGMFTIGITTLPGVANDRRYYHSGPWCPLGTNLYPVSSGLNASDPQVSLFEKRLLAVDAVVSRS